MALGFNDMQETVLLVHPVGKDEWGDPLPGTGTSVQITEALYAPGASQEMDVNANVVDADGTLYIEPASATVGPHDRLMIRNQMYEVAGQPRMWQNTLTEIPVRRVTG